MKERKCSKCKNVFPLSKEFFHKSKSQDGYFRYTCKTCENKRHEKYRHKDMAKNREIQRKAYLKRNYGITPEEYNNMVDLQENKCAICRKEETAIYKGRQKNLAVDHCHNTGENRYLLCQNCNTVLGKVGEDVEILNSMIEYIEFWNLELGLKEELD